jgi:arsenate reductase
LSEAPRPAAFITAPPRGVLFLCVHNSARSQIAEGWGRALAPEGVRIWSAGTNPAGVNPIAIEVMREVGVDISGQSSKHVDQVPLDEADTVVTLCAEEVCPVVRGDVRRVHWPLPDPGHAPEERQIEAFRQCRDEIRWRVSSLWPRST